MDITINHADHTYTATVEGADIEIYRDGQWAGDGQVHNGQICDCAAVIPEEVYAAIERAMKAAQ